MDGRSPVCRPGVLQDSGWRAGRISSGGAGPARIILAAFHVEHCPPAPDHSPHSVPGPTRTPRHPSSARPRASHSQNARLPDPPPTPSQQRAPSGSGQHPGGRRHTDPHTTHTTQQRLHCHPPTGHPSPASAKARGRPLFSVCPSLLWPPYSVPSLRHPPFPGHGHPATTPPKRPPHRPLAHGRPSSNSSTASTKARDTRSIGVCPFRESAALGPVSLAPRDNHPPACDSLPAGTLPPAFRHARMPQFPGRHTRHGQRQNAKPIVPPRPSSPQLAGPDRGQEARLERHSHSHISRIRHGLARWAADQRLSGRFGERTGQPVNRCLSLHILLLPWQLYRQRRVRHPPAWYLLPAGTLAPAFRQAPMRHFPATELAPDRRQDAKLIVPGHAACPELPATRPAVAPTGRRAIRGVYPFRMGRCRRTCIPGRCLAIGRPPGARPRLRHTQGARSS